MPRIHICTFCNVEFTDKNRRAFVRFCSRDCSNKSRADQSREVAKRRHERDRVEGRIAGRYIKRGGKSGGPYVQIQITTLTGRARELAEAMRASPRSRYVYEHRLAKALELDRPLDPLEQIHHIDGDKFNNDPNNLEILDNRDHKLEHWAVNKKMLALESEKRALERKVQQLEAVLASRKGSEGAD